MKGRAAILAMTMLLGVPSMAFAGTGATARTPDPSTVTAAETPAGLPEGGISIHGSTLAGKPLTRSYLQVVTAAYPSGCFTIDAWRNKYTTLGSLAYRWHQTKYYCYSNGTITYVSIGYYISDNNGFNVFQGISGTAQNYISVDGNPKYGHYSLRQATMQNCVYICLFTDYPWVKIWAYADGSWSYDVGG